MTLETTHSIHGALPCISGFALKAIAKGAIR